MTQLKTSHGRALGYTTFKHPTQNTLWFCASITGGGLPTTMGIHTATLTLILVYKQFAHVLRRDTKRPKNTVNSGGSSFVPCHHNGPGRTTVLLKNKQFLLLSNLARPDMEANCDEGSIASHGIRGANPAELLSEQNFRGTRFFRSHLKLILQSGCLCPPSNVSLPLQHT